jgi:hypothetical protein
MERGHLGDQDVKKTQRALADKQIVAELVVLSWNPEVHYRAHKTSHYDPKPNQLIQVNTVTSCSLKIDFSIIFPPKPSL